MSSASARVGATHIATSSPTCRTLPVASTGCSETLKPGSADTARIGLTPTRSAAVKTLARYRSGTCIPRIRACAKGLRTNATSWSPARRMSATNRPRPRIRRSSSLRGSRAPTPCPAPAEEKSRSLRTVAFSSIGPDAGLLGRNRLRQNWRDRVISRAGTKTERGLQQALGDNFVLFVVAQDKSSGSLSNHRNIRVPADLEGADLFRTAEHLGRL